MVSDMNGLKDALSGADWVITGEGRSDSQTLYGKVPIHVAQLAKAGGVKPLLISGEGHESLYEHFVSCHSICNQPMSLESCIDQAKPLLYH
jgi:glycerate kinase